MNLRSSEEATDNHTQTLKRAFKIYLPYTCFAIIGMALVSTPLAVILELGFILVQVLLWELNAKYGDSLWVNSLKLDISPFAAIFFGYFFSFWAGAVGMLIPVLLQDFDRNTSKLTDWEAFIFNIVVAGLAALLRSWPFLPLAAALIVIRLVVLLILHYFVFGDVNPSKILSEGSSALVFLALLIALMHIFF